MMAAQGPTGPAGPAGPTGPPGECGCGDFCTNYAYVVQPVDPYAPAPGDVNRIAVIDPNTQEVVNELQLEDAVAVAADPAGNLLYVAQGYGGISAINASTGALLRHENGYFGDVAYNPANGKLYAADSLNAELYIFNAADFALLNTVPVPNLREVEADPVTGTVYALGYNSLVLIDGESDTEFDDISFSSAYAPKMALCSKCERLYLVHAISGMVGYSRLYRYDLNPLNEVESEQITSHHSMELAYNPVTNTVLLADNAFYLSAFDGDTLAPLPQGYTAESGFDGVAVDAVHNLVYAVSGNAVYLFRGNPETPLNVLPTGEGYRTGNITVSDCLPNGGPAGPTGPAGLSACDPSYLFVGDRMSGNLSAYDPVTGALIRSVTDGAGIVKSNPNARRVYVLTEEFLAEYSAASLELITDAGVSQMTSIAADACGNTILAQTGGGVEFWNGNHLTGPQSAVQQPDVSGYRFQSVPCSGMALAIGGGALYKICGRDRTVTEIARLENPTTAAYNPHTCQYYVYSALEGRVTILDAAGNEMSRFPVPQNLHDIAVNPRTNVIYLAGFSGQGAVQAWSTDGQNLASSDYASANYLEVNPRDNLVYADTGLAIRYLNGETLATVASVQASPSPGHLFFSYYDGCGCGCGGCGCGGCGGVTGPTGPTGPALECVTENFAYALSAGELDVIDQNTRQLVESIPLQGPGGGIASDPAKGEVYYTSGSDLHVLHREGGGTTGIPFGVPLGDIFVNPAADRIYVRNNSLLHLLLLEGGTFDPIDTLPVYSEIFSDPVTGTAYGIHDGDIIDTFNGATGQVYTYVRAPDAINHAALDAARGVLYLLIGTNQVLPYDTETFTFGIPLGTPEDIRNVAVNPLYNQLYVLYYDGGYRVAAYDLDSLEQINDTAIITGLLSMTGFRVDPATGRLFYFEDGATQIYQGSGDGSLSHLASVPGNTAVGYAFLHDEVCPPCCGGGSAGPTGPQGEAGPQGAVGPQGAAGPQGPAGLTPHIGPNGNWFIGVEDTGVPACCNGGGNGGGPTGPTGPTGALPAGCPNDFDKAFISVNNRIYVVDLPYNDLGLWVAAPGVPAGSIAYNPHTDELYVNPSASGNLLYAVNAGTGAGTPKTLSNTGAGGAVQYNPASNNIYVAKGNATEILSGGSFGYITTFPSVIFALDTINGHSYFADNQNRIVTDVETSPRVILTLGGTIGSLAADSAGHRLLAVTGGNTLNVIDTQTETVIDTFPVTAGSSVFGMGQPYNQAYLDYMSGGNRYIQVYSLQNGQLLYTSGPISNSAATPLAADPVTGAVAAFDPTATPVPESKFFSPRSNGVLVFEAAVSDLASPTPGGFAFFTCPPNGGSGRSGPAPLPPAQPYTFVLACGTLHILDPRTGEALGAVDLKQ